VDTDAGGNATFSVTLPMTVADGPFIAATATDPSNNTSEFSQVFQTPESCVPVVTNTADSGPGSLRAAIDCANSMPGMDTISFNIPGAGVHTISPTSALPAITDPVVIDGYTQPGASPNTLAIGDNAVLLIEIDGSSAGSDVNGLTISAGMSMVRGLVINRFVSSSAAGGNGIALTTNGGDQIEGNFIGTDLSGASARGNSFGLSIVSGVNDTIGGTSAAARNVVSANVADGVAVYNFAATGTLIQGNYIGTNAGGTSALGNGFWGVEADGSSVTIGGAGAGAGNVIAGSGFDGILANGASGTIMGNYIGLNATGTAKLANSGAGVLVHGSNVTIGGALAGAGNVISGNTSHGVNIVDGGNGISGVLIQGNRIGTDAAGVANLGNGGFGVRLFAGGEVPVGATNNTIGGTAAGAGNVIAFNGQGGITIAGTSSAFAAATIGNRISGNSIFSNIGLGIDLGGDGVTPNTPGGPHTGANNLQNFPVITSVTSSGGSTTIAGTFNSTPSTKGFRLEFFANTAADPSGFGQGQTFIGFKNVDTDGGGNATFSVTLPVTVPAGQFVTATATDPNNNTSEFSAAVAVAQAKTGTPDLRLSVSDGKVSTTPGSTLTYRLDYANMGNHDATGVTLTEHLPAGTTFTAAASTAGWTDRGAGVFSLTIGSLAALNHQSGFALFVVKVNNMTLAGQDQTVNTASIADDGANGADPTPLDNTATHTDTLVAAPDLHVRFTDSETPTTLTYTFHFANGGNQDASGVKLTETLPKGTTFNAGASTEGWTQTAPGSRVFKLTVGNLAGGDRWASAVFTVRAIPHLPAGQRIVNTASIADDGANGADPTPRDNTQTDTDTLVPAHFARGRLAVPAGSALRLTFTFVKHESRSNG